MGDTQLVFVDLPGFAKPATLLGKRLNRMARAEVAGADIILLLVDASTEVGKGDRYLVERICRWDIPVVCVVNKVDLAGKVQTARTLAACQDLASGVEGFPGFAEYVPISASTGEGVEVLLRILEKLARPAPFLFDEGTGLSGGVADLDVLVAEIVREKLIAGARDELPYSIAVVVEEISKRSGRDLLDISAKVVVERDSQKGLVIGERGSRLRNAGEAARRELEKMTESQVYLNLRVVVMKDWQGDPKALSRLGY